MQPRLFLLMRDEDVSGVSGTGVVAEGVRFSDGSCVMRWRTPPSSIGIYQNESELLAIHGHNGKTYILWGELQKEAVEQ